MIHHAPPTSRLPRSLAALLFAGLLFEGLVACEGATPEATQAPGQEAEQEAARVEVHPTTVVYPDGLGLLDTAETTASGEAVGVRCSTCHTSAEPLSDPPKRKAEEFTEFHTDMNFAHGPLDCQSCHAPDDRDQLRLASADTIAFADVMELCAQCHGPQTRDWRNGSHGGMNGYWDTSRGPRTRNSCVNCHDPHAPAFPQVMPVHPPRDRFLSAPADEEHH